MSYSSYDHDNLETAETMKIERRIYFESEKSDLSGLAALPLSEETKVLPGHEAFSTMGQERRSNPYLNGMWF